MKVNIVETFGARMNKRSIVVKHGPDLHIYLFTPRSNLTLSCPQTSELPNPSRILPKTSKASETIHKIHLGNLLFANSLPTKPLFANPSISNTPLSKPA